MDEYKGGFLKNDTNEVIDVRDKSSIHPNLMKKFMIINDKKDGPIKCWEMTVMNTISHYIENHPEDFKKILESMDYEYIVDIYGEVATIDNIFKFYSFEEAFIKYIDWIDKMESNMKQLYVNGYERMEFSIHTFRCGNCHQVLEYPYTFDQDYKPGLKCPKCNHELYTKNQYRFKYGFNANKLINYSKFELVNINDL